MAKVESLHVSEGSMRPMLSKRRLKLIPGVGVEGDRYATGQGTYEAFKEPGRQLTVIAGDSAEASICGLPRQPAGGVGDLRRNVVVTGMTAAALNDSVGHNLKLGGCVVLVHRRCVPCMYNERLNRSPGLMEAAWEAGGVNCEILRGGDLSVGDAVEVEPGSYGDGRANDAAFYKRPSLRTREEARSLAQIPKNKPGVDRILAAYATVGAGDTIGLSAEEIAELKKSGLARSRSSGGAPSRRFIFQDLLRETVLRGWRWELAAVAALLVAVAAVVGRSPFTSSAPVSR